MTADIINFPSGPQNEREWKLLRIYRSLPPARQAVLRIAVARSAAGQPIKDAFVDAMIECGWPPAEARRELAEALP